MSKSPLGGTADRGRTRLPSWYQTISFRFAAVLAVTLVAFDQLRRPVFDGLLKLLGLEHLERTSLGATVTVLSVVSAILVAAVVAIVLSGWLTGRLRALSRAAADAMVSEELPPPFDEQGGDEVAALASAMNALRSRVDERIKEFNLRDIRRREWIAQVSHDLRTPLTAQLACLDRLGSLLRQQETPMRRDQLLELLAVAKMDADRVHILADDLLEIARLDAGDQLHLEPVPPGELVRQAVRGLEPLAAQRGIKVEIHVTSRLPVLNADGRRLTRAIENLLRNAIQHARTQVDVHAVLATGCVRFEVRDDGRGLPRQPDFLQYLRRLSSDVRLAELAKRRGRADSAGLGLVVAQRVAEAHHGVVDAYDLSKGGAAFLMDIPVPPESAATTETPPLG